MCRYRLNNLRELGSHLGPVASYTQNKGYKSCCAMRDLSPGMSSPDLLLVGDEVLTITKPDGDERVVIIRDGSTIVLQYAGKRASMLRTIEEMRLPRSGSANLGERLFERYDTLLRRTSDDLVGCESSFPVKFVGRCTLALSKLAQVYAGQDIDCRFYGALKRCA